VTQLVLSATPPRSRRLAGQRPACHGEASGAPRLLRKLVREGLDEDALPAAAALVLTLQAEAGR
jgi:hypothetical protein